MLRSRSNRQQRPSESTDEQQGRSDGSSFNYGGYPSSSGSGRGPLMVGIASGADDGDYHTPQRTKSGPSRFGFGSGGGASYTNKSYGKKGSFENRDAWDRRQMGSTVKVPKHGGGGIGSIMFSFLLILIMAMGGATIHFRKMNDRMQHELTIVNRRTKGRRHLNNRFDRDEGNIAEERGGWNNLNADKDPNDAKDTQKVNPQVLGDLRTRQRELEGESNKWRNRVKIMEGEILALRSQIDNLEKNEISSYNLQISTMDESLQSERAKGHEFKQQFMETHKSGLSGIVPGGPGHALVQRRELEKMESLEDYEIYVQRREDALWDKIDLLVEKLGAANKREAKEWFGPGPHNVELEIEYPQYTEDKDPEEWPRVRGVFEIEMAPLDLMPISVNLFLQQVHHKLWNGCSFVINAMHILQAGPHRYSEGGGYDANLSELMSRFEKARLDRMPFQEYNEDYPHVQYTVGFAGRPGGPDFYINKINNSVNHGPGGQNHHDLHEEADPCFAKLVGGTNIIRDINRVPSDYAKGSLLLYPVVIVDSRVMVTKEGNENNQQKQGADGT